MKTEPNEPINGKIKSKEVGNERGEYTHVQTFSEGGLTKREYFAGLAMQGMISTVDYYRPGEYPHVAEAAVKMADALIAQLNKD